MHQHGAAKTHLAGDKRRVILVGNPNVGKSIIFSQLSGRYATVSNYPGTTVEVSHAEGRLPGSPVIIDTPGINSLIPQSEDERIARDILLEEGERMVVQVSDAKNIRRALVISSQLAEMGIPFVLDLNMWDEAQGRGIALDIWRLSQILGVPVVETVAVRQQGLARLKEALTHPAQSTFRVGYDNDIQQAATAIAKELPGLPIPPLAAAMMLLSGDESLRGWLEQRGNGASLAQVDAIIAPLRERHQEPLGYLISQQRQAAIEKVLSQVIRTERRPGYTLADRLGAWSMHPIAGIPLLLAILYLIYKLVGEFGAGVVVDFIESVVFGEYLNPWAIALFHLIPIPIVQELFVGNYGLITMGLTYALSIVLPIMSFFFVAFGILEDSGYLPRLAIMVNRVFGLIGLNGRAVLPMVLGLGCDTMATLTTRILESRRERLIATLLLALGIPCSAQLGVILAMLGGVGSERAFALFVVVLASQFLLVGFLASRVLPGETSDFIIEIPPIRMPKPSNVLLKTYYRVEWFLKEAVPLFLLGTFILFLADKAAILGALEAAASPIVQNFLSLPGEATSSFIMGFLRRDYGAAGLFVLQERGLLDTTQVVVSLVVITLFVPCIANFFVIIKERGLRTALAMVGFISPFAVLVGGGLNFLLRFFEVAL